jgi:hypothetical protein
MVLMDLFLNAELANYFNRVLFLCLYFVVSWSCTGHMLADITRDNIATVCFCRYTRCARRDSVDISL